MLSSGAMNVLVLRVAGVKTGDPGKLRGKKIFLQGKKQQEWERRFQANKTGEGHFRKKEQHRQMQGSVKGYGVL